MKILLISDQPDAGLWDYYSPEKLRGIDLILSCGDLPRAYLEFLVTMGRAPVLYVHGNHDDSYSLQPPEGCDCIDGKLVCVNGLRILGLGGCMRYRDGIHQYTELQMCLRIAKLWWRIWRRGGVDVVVCHAPIQGIRDGEDRAHRGFACFRKLMERLHPVYWIHGHQHLNYGRNPRIHTCGDTTIINAYGKYILEIDTPL